MHPLVRLNPYILNYGWLSVTSVLCMICGVLLTAIAPVFVRETVDSIGWGINLYHLYRDTQVQSMLFRDLFWLLLLFGMVVFGISTLAAAFLFIARRCLMLVSSMLSMTSVTIFLPRYSLFQETSFLKQNW